MITNPAYGVWHTDYDETSSPGDYGNGSPNIVEDELIAEIDRKTGKKRLSLLRKLLKMKEREK